MAYAVHNFDYNTPTRLLFGRGKIERLPEVAAEFGKKVLLVYGGGSIKKLGIYDKVKTLLADCEIYECAGVEPNPKVTSVNEGARLCREHDVDFVLAVGGGSVIDCAKAICAARYYDGDAWDIVTDPSKITKALPLVTVLTLSATGSEYDPAAVISNMDENKKIGVLTPVFYPRVSICDPEYTFSVSKKQTAAGCADIMSHIFEQYCVKDSNLVSDGLCETVLRAVLGTGKRAYDKGDDYEARATLMWASSLACNGICVTGNSFAAWVCHGIEHELSAFYDITHGEGLAIVTPVFFRYNLNDETVGRFATLANRVFDVPFEADLYAMAEKGFQKLEAFFASIGLPSKLSQVGITSDEHFEAMAESCMKLWDFSQAIRPLTKDDVVEILKRCL